MERWRRRAQVRRCQRGPAQVAVREVWYAREKTMNETAAIEFVLHGKVEGLDITPRTIGLSLFNEFNQQVDCVRGLPANL